MSAFCRTHRLLICIACSNSYCILRCSKGLSLTPGHLSCSESQLRIITSWSKCCTEPFSFFKSFISKRNFCFSLTQLFIFCVGECFSIPLLVSSLLTIILAIFIIQKNGLSTCHPFWEEAKKKIVWWSFLWSKGASRVDTSKFILMWHFLNYFNCKRPGICWKIFMDSKRLKLDTSMNEECVRESFAF